LLPDRGRTDCRRRHNGDTRIDRSAVFLVQSVSPKKIDRRRGYLGKPKTEERRDDGHGEASEIDGKSLVEERVEKRFGTGERESVREKMCFNIYDTSTSKIFSFFD